MHHQTTLPLLPASSSDQRKVQVIPRVLEAVNASVWCDKMPTRKAKAVLLEKLTLVTRVSHGVPPSHTALLQHQSDLALVAREQGGYQTNPHKLLY